MLQKMHPGMGSRYHQKYVTYEMKGHEHVRFVLNTGDSLSLEMKQRT